MRIRRSDPSCIILSRGWVEKGGLLCRTSVFTGKNEPLI